MSKSWCYHRYPSAGLCQRPELEMSHYPWLYWFESRSCVLSLCYSEALHRAVFFIGSQQQRWRHTLKSRMCEKLYFILISTHWGLGCLPGCSAHSPDLLVLQELIAMFGNLGVHTTQTVKWHHCLLPDEAYLIRAWWTPEPKSISVFCNAQILHWKH